MIRSDKNFDVVEDRWIGTIECGDSIEISVISENGIGYIVRWDDKGNIEKYEIDEFISVARSLVEELSDT